MLQYSSLKKLCLLIASGLILICMTSLATLFFPQPIVAGGNATTPPTDSAPVETLPAVPPYLTVDNPNALISLDKPIYDNLLVTERQKRGLSTALPKLSPNYGEKVVYLTFDDGPNPINTPAVLALLKEFQIHATFFVVGNQAEKYPDLIKRIFAEGHAIGNHSYNHVYSDLYRSPKTYLAQLHHTDEIIKQAIGMRPLISRAPGGTVGNFTKTYWYSLAQEGYVDVGWNISSGDASQGKAADLIENIASQIQNKTLWSHATVLMHDGQGHGETVKALRQIIELFKNNGFEFRVVSLTTPPAW